MKTRLPLSPITDPPSPCDRSRNERGIGVDLSLFAAEVYTFEKLVPGPEMAACMAVQNQITERGLFASHPRTASRNIQTIPLPHPRKTVESSRESLRPTSPSPSPGPLGLLDGTRQSARTTVATFTAYRYPRFYLGLSVRRYGQVQTRPRRVEYRRKGCIYVCMYRRWISWFTQVYTGCKCPGMAYMWYIVGLRVSTSHEWKFILSLMGISRD